MSKIPQLLQFLEKSPNDAFLIHAIALEYAKGAELDNAIQYFEMNRENNPAYLATYYHLGKAYELVKDYDNAIAVYNEGIGVATEQQNMKTKNEIAMALEFLEDEL